MKIQKLEVLNHFQTNTGFKVNYDKTAVYRVGSLANTDAKLYTQVNLCWTNQPIDILGVKVCDNRNTQIGLNYDGMLDKVQGILTLWTSRKLSLIGKVTVVNTLVGSLFVYKMSILPILPDTYVHKLNKIVSNFVWCNRKAKIALAKLQNIKIFGGLGLVNFQNKDISLKTNWIKEVLEKENVANLAYKILENKMSHDLWKCNLHRDDIRVIFKESFWRDVLECWLYCNYKMPETEEDILNQVIWYNSYIRVANRPIFIKKAFQEGLKTFSSLVDLSGKQIKPELICAMYNIDILSYYNIWSAIPKNWKCKVVNTEISFGPYKYLAETLLIGKGSTSLVYKYLSGNEMLNHPAYVKWQVALQMDITYKEFLKLFQNIYLITNHSKHRSFQYRLLNHALIFNDRLFEWKILEHATCTYCKEEIETVMHFFIVCEKAKSWWCTIREYIKEKYEIVVQIDSQNIIFNTDHRDATHLANTIILIAKCYMYTKRCLQQDYRIEDFKKTVNQIQSFELYNAKKNRKTQKHYKKWFNLNQTKMDKQKDDFLDQYTHEQLLNMRLDENILD